MDYDEKSVATPDERLEAWVDTRPSLGRLRARGAAVPRWLRGILITGVFALPLLWVMGDNTPFDWVLALVTDLAGNEGPRYLASYLLCVLACLLPVAVFIQLEGARRLREHRNSE